MAAATGYKVNSGGTYVDLNTLFEAGSGGSQSVYKTPANKYLNEIFAPYVSGPQAIQTYYKDANNNDLNIVFAKKKNWMPLGSAPGLNGTVNAIAFDNNGTQIDCDINGSFFNLRMDSFMPERYYKILIQASAGGSTTIYDDNYYFKVSNGY